MLFAVFKHMEYGSVSRKCGSIINSAWFSAKEWWKLTKELSIKMIYEKYCAWHCVLSQALFCEKLIRENLIRY